MQSHIFGCYDISLSIAENNFVIVQLLIKCVIFQNITHAHSKPGTHLALHSPLVAHGKCKPWNSQLLNNNNVSY